MIDTLVPQEGKLLIGEWIFPSEDGRQVLIGRAKPTDIKLDKGEELITIEEGGSKKNISRIHAKILFKNSMIYLEDNSTNGTFLNGARMEKNKQILLNNGDTIDLLPERMKLEEREWITFHVGIPMNTQGIVIKADVGAGMQAVYLEQ